MVVALGGNGRSSGVHLRRKRSVKLAKACQPMRQPAWRAASGSKRSSNGGATTDLGHALAAAREPRQPRRAERRADSRSLRWRSSARPSVSARICAHNALREPPPTSDTRSMLAPPASSASWPSAKREGHALQHRARQLRPGRARGSGRRTRRSRADRCAACARPTGRAGRSDAASPIALRSAPRRRVALRCRRASAPRSQAQAAGGRQHHRSSGARCRESSGRTRAPRSSGAGENAALATK